MKKNIRDIEIGDNLHNVIMGGNPNEIIACIAHVDTGNISNLTEKKSPAVCVATTTLGTNDCTYGIFVTSNKAFFYYDSNRSSINVGKSKQIKILKK